MAIIIKHQGTRVDINTNADIMDNPSAQQHAVEILEWFTNKVGLVVSHTFWETSRRDEDHLVATVAEGPNYKAIERPTPAITMAEYYGRA